MGEFTSSPQEISPLGVNQTGFNLINFHFSIRGKLSIILNDKYLFLVCRDIKNIATLSETVNLFYNICSAHSLIPKS